MIPYNKNNPAKSICIMRLSAIGDVCHTIPVVKTLQHYWPECQITWIIGKAEFSLVKELPGVEFIIFDKAQGIKAYSALKQQLANRNFDLLLHLQEALRSSIATLFIKAKIKLGFPKLDSQDFQWLFCQQHVAYQPRIHYMDRLLLFTEALGLSPAIHEWNIPVSPEDTQKALSLIPEKQPYIVISPCSSVRKNNYRNLSKELYAQIAESIASKYHRAVVLTGGPSELEIEFGEYIEQHCNAPVINLIGKLNLKQLLVVLEKAQAVISPDSGPAHMANTVNTPVIALFATSNPDFTGPYNHRDWIINRYPDALAKFSNTNVEYAKWGQRVRVEAAMNLITLADVEEKLNKLPPISENLPN
ncbi:MAG: glycosyltransferase family 9 protein, partial [Gammaproteobacteria bacterium]|nr:glycosyltransferase family 9 protein [Gammaproteobacteria bacterium]